MRSTPIPWSLLFLLLLFHSMLPTALGAAEGTVLYRLEKGSTLQDDCLICGRPPIVLPLEGTFLLTLQNIGDVTDWYQVDAIDFHTTDRQYLVSGSGRYLTRLGNGGVIVTQLIFLEVEINGEGGIQLESGEAAVDDALPAINLQAEEHTLSQVRVFKLQLIAHPVEVEPPFRRGDSNGDGAIDLSDAVHALSWLFTGGGAPGCLDAADVDGSEEIDLTDAVYLLGYLFLSGQEPPEPGPSACGRPAGPGLGCISYSCI